MIEHHHGIRPAALAEEWNALADRCGAEPFLRPSWLGPWATAFAHGRLDVLAAREDGRLVGLLPLHRTRGALALPVNAHTPLAGPLAEHAEVAAELADALLALRPARLTLAHVGAEDLHGAALVARAERAGYLLASRTVLRSPYIAADATDYASWLRERRRKFRAELGRRERRLAEQGEVARGLETSADLDAVLDDAYRIEASGWKGERRTAIAARGSTARFYRELAAATAADGTLRLFTLRLDGQLLAFVLALEGPSALYLIKSGYDASQHRFSPGGLTIMAAIEHGFTQGLARIELLGTDEAHKLEWTDTLRERRTTRAFRPGIAGYLTRGAAQHARPLAERAKLDRALRPLRDHALARLDPPERRNDKETVR